MLNMFYCCKIDQHETDNMDQVKIVSLQVLTFSVPGRHGNEPADAGSPHGTDHCLHREGIPRYPRKEGGRKAEAGHDRILTLEMKL